MHAALRAAFRAGERDRRADAARAAPARAGAVTAHDDGESRHRPRPLRSTLGSVRLRIARAPGPDQGPPEASRRGLRPRSRRPAPRDPGPPPQPRITTADDNHNTTAAPAAPALCATRVSTTDARRRRRRRHPPPWRSCRRTPAQSQMMSPQPELTFSSTQPQNGSIINVDEHTRYQQFTGVGAAMTDSSAWLICNKMSTTQRTALLQDLFGRPGSGTGLAAPPIHLNFLRIGVAATGAMTVTPAYSYDDNPPGGSDPGLTSFSISHDTSYIIPALQQALAIDPGLQILASPWSPPGWMKGNGAPQQHEQQRHAARPRVRHLRAVPGQVHPGLRERRDTDRRPHPSQRADHRHAVPGPQPLGVTGGPVHRAGPRAGLGRRRPPHEDLRKRPELGSVLRVRESARLGPERRARPERNRLALLLQLPDGHEPAPPAGPEPRSDRRRMLARDQAVRDP